MLAVCCPAVAFLVTFTGLRLTFADGSPTNDYDNFRLP
jgi:hypothetical protein